MTGATADQPLTNRTGFLIQKVAFLSINSFEEALTTFGLSSRSYYVLSGIAQEKPPSQQELARLLTIDPTTIVAIVDELQNAGFVNRVRSSTDRRRNELLLTEDGVAALQKANQLADDEETEFFAPLTEAQRAGLHEALVLLVRNRWPLPPS
jgi:DNA-binding MarR family transcriptional regulator